MIFVSLGIFLLFVSASCLPDNHTDSSVNAAIDAGTFQNPSVNVRPRFRYWVPDASVDHEQAAQDVATAKAAGAGGVEVLGYYLYNSAPGNYAPSDWATYGWGTPAWKQLFDAIAQAHQDNGMIMDFAMGPNQGQGVPADPDNDGLMWDINAYNVSIPVGGSFNNTIPGWKNGVLQAVVTGLVISEVNASGVAPSLPNDLAASRVQKTLANNTLHDVTDMVDANGHLSLQFPTDPEGIEYNLFAIYLVREQERTEADPATLEGPQTQAQSLVQNGSWTVDHFSSLGAQTVTNFWENYLLVNGTKELLMSVGNYGWEDSVEINPYVYWTRYLPKAFSTKFGYSINKWLPLLFHQNQRWFGAPAEPIWWVTDEPDAGDSHIADYRATLTDLYGEYLSAFNSWAEQYLNVQYSAQISYNLAMDMLQNIPVVDAPECESLDFNDNIDAYRQYTGAANLAGKRVISSECGAVSDEAFQQTLTELMWKVRRSIVGGINQFVFHGYPYSGNYGNTTWPSFATFNYTYSEMHGRHQPAWDYYSDPLNFTARLSYIFQSGVPKVDLAFYQYFTTYPGHRGPNYMLPDLDDAGYTYEYISPNNFNLPGAYVQNAILAPDGPAFKAMIIRANDSLTVEGTAKLAEFAEAGLPIVFSGGLPSYLASFNETGAAYVNATIQSLTRLPNVHVIPYTGLAESVASLGITPRASFGTSNGSLFTAWRYDNKTAADYVFVYNDAAGYGLGDGSTSATIEFESIGDPYEYNAWTGEQISMLNYTQTSNTTSIYFELAGNQSTIVAFQSRQNGSSTLPSAHLESASPHILGISADTSSALSLKVGPGPGSPSFRLPNGQTQNLTSISASSITLSNWTLNAEHWDPPANLSDISTIAVKSNTTHSLQNLVSWQSVPGLENVSGRGYYSANFSWPPIGSAASNDGSSPASNTSFGAFIDFGPVIHTLRASLNRQALPSLDTTSARADISQYLVNGENTLEAVISTTLVNVLRPIWGDLRTSGVAPAVGVPGAQGYGLVGSVRVIPYQVAQVPIH
ncbi:MAG: hypothetical protein M1822_002113 [Bathelium mastoideum]|nr:MAG: hypothetical protein M1822_002113 [Bathelium mastoideum]